MDRTWRRLRDGLRSRRYRRSWRTAVQCEQRRTIARLGLLGDGAGNTENGRSDRSPGMVPCTATDADDAAQGWRSEQGEAPIGERLDRGDASETRLEEAGAS